MLRSIKGISSAILAATVLCAPNLGGAESSRSANTVVASVDGASHHGSGRWGHPRQNRDSVKLYLSGYVPSKCEITARDSEIAVDLSRAGEQDILFDINCNEPMSYRITSTNGRFANQGDIEFDPADFTDHVPYRASFRLRGMRGRVTAKGDELVSGVMGDTEGATPFETVGKLRVQWRAPKDAGHDLVAGIYLERFTITVRSVLQLY